MFLIFFFIQLHSIIRIQKCHSNLYIFESLRQSEKIQARMRNVIFYNLLKFKKMFYSISIIMPIYLNYFYISTRIKYLITDLFFINEINSNNKYLNNNNIPVLGVTFIKLAKKSIKFKAHFIVIIIYYTQIKSLFVITISVLLFYICFIYFQFKF